MNAPTDSRVRETVLGWLELSSAKEISLLFFFLNLDPEKSLGQEQKAVTIFAERSQEWPLHLVVTLVPL